MEEHGNGKVQPGWPSPSKFSNFGNLDSFIVSEKDTTFVNFNIRITRVSKTPAMVTASPVMRLRQVIKMSCVVGWRHAL